MESFFIEIDDNTIYTFMYKVSNQCSLLAH